MSDQETSNNSSEVGVHFCEKLFHFAEDPAALNHFSDQEMLMLLQFLIYGTFLNEKQELYFDVGPNLGRYIKRFALDETSLDEARDQIYALRMKDQANRIDFPTAVSNYVNDIIIRYLKQ